jgi:hypothetical protein
MRCSGSAAYLANAGYRGMGARRSAHPRHPAHSLTRAGVGARGTRHLRRPFTGPPARVMSRPGAGARLRSKRRRESPGAPSPGALRHRQLPSPSRGGTCVESRPLESDVASAPGASASSAAVGTIQGRRGPHLRSRHQSACRRGSQGRRVLAAAGPSRRQADLVPSVLRPALSPYADQRGQPPRALALLRSHPRGNGRDVRAAVQPGTPRERMTAVWINGGRVTAEAHQSRTRLVEGRPEAGDFVGER